MPTAFDRYEEVEPAVEKYFNAYKIEADLTGAPLAQFAHPIYLKIFCETKNRERKIDVQVYVGEQTLFEVFDEYLEQCNEAVCNRLGLRPRNTYSTTYIKQNSGTLVAKSQS